MGGSVESLGEELAKFTNIAISTGLMLNVPKCEIIGLSPPPRQFWEETGMGNSFKEPLSSETTLLSAPLFDDGFSSRLKAHMAVFEKVGERLLLMTAHESFFLHKRCLAMPRWLHLLRTSHCTKSASFRIIDDVQRKKRQ